MEIKPLSNSSFDELIQCFLASFEGYFVKMPADLDYWKSRFDTSKVDYDLSYGAYDDDTLCGFIINAIDTMDGKRKAYNTGTGVLPAYRGNKWVDKIYAHAIPILRDHGIEQCCLEVIQKNAVAIRVYERIGFSISHGLYCYNGNLPNNPRIADLDIIQRDHLFPYKIQDHLYAWEAKSKCINRSTKTFNTYEVLVKDQSIGFFILEEHSGYVAQYELCIEDTTHNWALLFQGIHQVSPSVKLNNVNSSRRNLIKYLSNSGLNNVINQYEMIKNI